MSKPLLPPPARTMVWLSLLLACAVCRFSYAATDDRPNFVVVMTDDQSPMPWPVEGSYRGARPFGYCGADDVYTPHIDRLAADGVVFDRAYVSSSVCSPSRYALLTGRYGGRSTGPSFSKLHPPGTITRVENNTELEADRSNVARLLSEAGYDTGFVGKCHLIDHHLYQSPEGRQSVGLQVYDRRADPRDPTVNAMMRANHRWWTQRVTDYGFNWAGGVYAANLLELKSEPLNAHNVDWTTEAALEFLDRPRDGPFFLYYATTIPHGPDPWDKSDTRGDYWSGVNSDPAVTGEGYRPDLAEESAQYRREAKQAIAQRSDSLDEAWLTWFDASIGRLREKLESRGELDNTVFILLSDHGSWRHGKTTLYEGGVRVPLLIHWPAGAASGARYDGLVQNIDITPTVLDLAGIEPPDDEILDGASLARVLRGEEALERESLFFELGFARGVVDRRWKYIAVRYDDKINAQIAAGRRFQGFKNSGDIDRPYMTRNAHLGHHASQNNPNYFLADQLYDLESDPREENNVFDDFPEVAERMRALLRDYLLTFSGRPYGEFTRDEFDARNGKHPAVYKH